MSAITFDWQSWLACGLGLLAVLHLTRRWWPKRLQRHHGHELPGSASSATPGSGGGCGNTVEAPSACGDGGCGSCGSSTTPIRVHRRTSRDTSGTTPNP